MIHHSNIKWVKFVVWRILFILMPLVVSPSTSASAPEKWTWFLSNQLYYTLYDDVTSLAQARDLCSSRSDDRLAIFDDDVSLNDVKEYISLHYPSDDFWVDAERKVTGGANYTWANNCSLAADSPLWGAGEPASGQPLTIIRYIGTSIKYFTVSDGHLSRPLCQSASAPTNYLPTPPTLTWVSLGDIGHMFGFSNDMRSYTDAKKACEDQAGEVYLADLDTLSNYVMQYVLDNHPDRIYWLDVTQISNTGVLSTAWQWPSGTSLANSLYYIGDYSSLVMVKQNAAIKLAPSLGASLNYYVCKGNPAPESTSSLSPPSLTWVALGTPSRLFGFSTDKKKFRDAKEACAAQTGRGTVRLAVLNTLGQEVMDWVEANQPSREFWLDVSRPTTSADFLWGDGKAIDADYWVTGEPDNDDLVGRLRPQGGQVGLQGTSTHQTSRNYVCEQVPDVTLEWRLLGSPPELFGFSRTQSWGLEWARHACSSQLGDVKLASLDTHFNDVITVIQDRYPNDQFWIDATLPTGETSFRWDNGGGANVGGTMWLPGEPSNAADTVARITSGTGTTRALASHSDLLEPFYFVCQGQPASSVEPAQFSSPCQLEETVDDFYCNCSNSSVPSPSVVVNISTEDMGHATQVIREDLLLDTSSLSSTRRKLNSADDSRPSARALGGFGIIILILTVAVIVAPDTIDVARFIARVVQTDRAVSDDGKGSKGDAVIEDPLQAEGTVDGDVVLSDM